MERNLYSTNPSNTMLSSYMSETPSAYAAQHSTNTNENSLEFYRMKYIEALEGRVILHQEITSRDVEIREKDNLIKELKHRLRRLEDHFGIDEEFLAESPVEEEETVTPALVVENNKRSLTDVSVASASKKRRESVSQPVIQNNIPMTFAKKQSSQKMVATPPLTKKNGQQQQQQQNTSVKSISSSRRGSMPVTDEKVENSEVEPVALRNFFLKIFYKKKQKTY
jgi:hypothetical protein